MHEDGKAENPAPRFDLIVSFADLGPDFSFRKRNIQRIVASTPALANIVLVEWILPGREACGAELAQWAGAPDRVQLIAIEGKEHYNKQYAFNVGACHAKTGNLVFSDSDVVVSPDYYARLLEVIERHSPEWLIGWGDLVYLSEDGSVLEQQRPSKHLAEGGIVYFDKTFFAEIGGYNDWMREVVAGDNEIIRRAEFRTGSYNILDETAWHYWHPQSTIKKTLSKYYELNRRILNFSLLFPEQQIALLTATPFNAKHERWEVCSWQEQTKASNAASPLDYNHWYPERRYNAGDLRRTEAALLNSQLVLEEIQLLKERVLPFGFIKGMLRQINAVGARNWIARCWRAFFPRSS